MRIVLCLLFPILLFSQTLFNSDELEYIKNKKIILVSNEYNYEPYNYFYDGKPKGYSIDLLELLLRDTGLEIKYVTKPFNELLNDMSNGKLDLLNTIYKTKEREKTLSFSIGYSKIINNYVIQKNQLDITGIEDLYGKTVGISKGWLEEEVFNMYPQIRKKYFKNINDKLDALTTGEIDAIMSSGNVAKYYITKYGYNNLKVSNPIRDGFAKNLTSHHFATLKSNETLISILNKKYNSLSITQLEELNKKWFGTIPKHRVSLTFDEKLYLTKNKTINMCVDPTWQPFDYINEKKVHDGMSSDYIKIIKKILNIDFNLIKTESWTQTLQYSKERKCDIISLAMKTPKREKYLNFTTPYLKVPLVIATDLDVHFIERFSELKNKKIGIVKDYAIFELIKNKYPDINVVEVNNLKEAIKMVSKGELFGFLDTLPTISYYFQTLQEYQLKIAGKIDFNWELGIAVRNDDPILLSVLNKSLNTITPEEKRSILNKWISIKYEKNTDYSLAWKIFFIFLIIIFLIVYKQYLLKKSLADFTKLIDSTMEAIIVFKNGKCINGNKSALKIFNYKQKNELKNKTVYDFINNCSSKILDKMLKSTSITPYEVLAKKKDNNTFYALINYYEVKNRNISVLSVVDITKIKELESRTKQAQMGEMIENIAHQWRQPLSTISTIVSGVKINHQFGVANNIEENMDMVLKTTTYLSDTIETFRNFLKEQKEYKDVILQDRISLSLGIVSATLENVNIKLINKVDKEPIPISLYVGELSQVIINILNNAKDVLIERKINNPWIEIDVLKEKDKVIITIEDNGNGIDDEFVNRIFDPYFTTKHSSVGTGLGLHMSYKIVTESLKGKLYVYNTESGAKFNIELPLNKSDEIPKYSI